MKTRLWMLLVSVSVGLLSACGNVDEESMTLAQGESSLAGGCPCGGLKWACEPCAFLCGDNVCDTFLGENSQNCLEDCPVLPFCGDGLCNNGETSSGCPQDCGPVTVCGDGVCNGSENAASCPTDCPLVVCGDGVCNGTETLQTCPMDCGGASCGDGLCQSSEVGWCSDCVSPCTGPNCPVVPVFD